MRTFALILQGVCVLLTGSGLALEYFSGVNLGLLLITAGSFIFAVSVKINKIRILKDNRKLLNDKNNDHG